MNVCVMVAEAHICKTNPRPGFRAHTNLIHANCCHLQYADASYWDARYQREAVCFDWYLTYHGLEPVLKRHIPADATILQVSGTNARLLALHAVCHLPNPAALIVSRLCVCTHQQPQEQWSNSLRVLRSEQQGAVLLSCAQTCMCGSQHKAGI